VANPPSSSTISAARSIIRGIRSGVIPSGLGMTSRSAPKARIIVGFSGAKASEVTILSG
jgi:hypothetical protein